MKKILFLMIFALFLSACAPAVNVENSDAAGQSANPTPVTPSKGGGNEAVIVYERSGGFTGQTDSYQVYADGRIVSGKGDERSVTPEEVEEALGAIEKAGFFDDQEPVSPKGTCNDCYTYTIQANYEGKSHSMTVVDNGQLPEDVWQVINAVEALVIAQ